MNIPELVKGTEGTGWSEAVAVKTSELICASSKSGVCSVFISALCSTSRDSDDGIGLIVISGKFCSAPEVENDDDLEVVDLRDEVMSQTPIKVEQQPMKNIKVWKRSRSSNSWNIMAEPIITDMVKRAK